MVNLIAEIGINHNGDLDKTRKMIEIASVAGFDYVKFQKRTPELCVPEEQKNKIKQTPWGEMTYLEYKRRIEFGEKEYREINRWCVQLDIPWFASVWDIESAKFMKRFSTIVKIPSALITNDELLKYCRKNFNTFLLSTGMSTEEEIQHAIEVGDPDVIFHTNSCYPSNPNNLNLNYIKWLIKKYPEKHIGYSGHEFGLNTTFATIPLGVNWIERHITLDRTMWGSDQQSSVEPIGMFKLTKAVREIESAMGIEGPRILGEDEKEKREQLRG